MSDPVEALERIAYLLERGREPTYRVRAFRSAASTLRALHPDEVRELTKTERLRELPGIGPTTERVVREALAGRTPVYLERLEAQDLDLAPARASDEPGSAHASAARAIRAALRGDCHTHSDWSDGGSPIEAMAKAASDLGHEYMALTDHSPRLTVAKGLSPERRCRQLDVVEALNAELAPFRILTGCEVDILEDGSLDLDEDLLARLDVVVASVHSKLRMDAEAMTQRMARAMANPHTDILGHCTGRIVVGRGRPPSSFDPYAVFEVCARFDKAVEINSRPERLDPPQPLLRLALDSGCKVAIDTDAHAPGQLEWLGYGCEIATHASVPVDAVINARPADELLAWAAAHES